MRCFMFGKGNARLLVLPVFLVFGVLFGRVHFSANQKPTEQAPAGTTPKPTPKGRELEQVSFDEKSQDSTCEKEKKSPSNYVPKLPDWMRRGKLVNITMTSTTTGGRDDVQVGTSPPRYHVGVLSSLKYLDSRAVDLYHTWGKEAKSLALYVGGNSDGSAVHSRELPVTVLPDTNDTSYPPQQKGFHLLKYWCENLLDKYDWFIKVDDDSYLKVAFLEKFLSGLDDNIKYYIGRSGSGLKHEIHLLGLHGNTFCCGPTVIYSKALLKDVCPHLETCLTEVVTRHEDTEVGRCMISKMGLQCSVSSNKILQSLFYQTYNKEYYKGDLSTNEKYTTAISVHEVKSSRDMYNLHFYYRQAISNATILPSVYKSNPLSVKPSKAKVKKEMCRKVKCVVPAPD